jgi:dihydrolipoamide dehydrogenase
LAFHRFPSLDRHRRHPFSTKRRRQQQKNILFCWVCRLSQYLARYCCFFFNNTYTMKLVISFAVVALVAVEAFVPASNLRHSPLTVLNAAADGEFDFDVAIIGCGVGGHGAALHSRAQGLSTAVFAGGDVGGTCVNRGCVPSKALLAASGRVREMKDTAHLESLGIHVDESAVQYSREGIANHAKNLASRVKGNLENSLVALGCDVIEGRGALTGNPQEVMDQSTGKVYKCKVC